jgi:hypothetical protein
MKSYSNIRSVGTWPVRSVLLLLAVCFISSSAIATPVRIKYAFGTGMQMPISVLAGDRLIILNFTQDYATNTNSYGTVNVTQTAPGSDTNATVVLGAQIVTQPIITSGTGANELPVPASPMVIVGPASVSISTPSGTNSASGSPQPSKCYLTYSLEVNK